MKPEISAIYDNLQQYGKETRALLNVLHFLNPHLTAAGHFKTGLWQGDLVGNTDIYKVYPTLGYIAQTAADVTTQLQIPFAHRWKRLQFNHTDAAYAANPNPLNITFYRQTGLQPPYFLDYIYAEDYIQSSQVTQVFDEGFEYEPSTYDLITQTTALHLVFPILYVQTLEG